MTQSISKTASSPRWMVIIAFATVYIVWGSTYFFIKVAINGFPPLLMGAIRFTTAGLLMLSWCLAKGERIFIRKSIITSAIVGLLLLGGGNGIVIWVEQTVPSGMAAIMVAAAPIWFVLLDKQNWRVNLKSKSTIAGLIIGFAGVILLFGEQLNAIFAGGSVNSKLPGMLLLLIGSILWTAGSLYSKHNPSEGSASVNVAWQMMIAGLVFFPAAFLHHEFARFQWQQIPAHAWLALGYLIVFGSIAAFSAYVWLLHARPATQVSTYAYVNPVIAVILGILFAHEHISLLQIIGLLIILASVLLINLSKYRKDNVMRLQEKLVKEQEKLVKEQERRADFVFKASLDELAD